MKSVRINLSALKLQAIEMRNQKKTFSEIAEKMKCPKSTVYRWVKNKNSSNRKRGRPVKISEQQIINLNSKLWRKPSRYFAFEKKDEDTKWSPALAQKFIKGELQCSRTQAWRIWNKFSKRAYQQVQEARQEARKQQELARQRKMKLNSPY